MPYEFLRKNLGPSDVLVQVEYCGVCYSDVHQARNEWDNTVYPCMPGHEIVGTVHKIGKDVKKFSIGEVVGVGCKVGVIGIGGLGHMAIKLAVAMGAEVTAVTGHKNKIEDAKAFGAKNRVLDSDPDAMKKAEASLDFFINTIKKF